MEKRETPKDEIAGPKEAALEPSRSNEEWSEGEKLGSDSQMCSTRGNAKDVRGRERMCRCADDDVAERRSERGPNKERQPCVLRND